MSEIKIGDKNKIKNTNIGHQFNTNGNGNNSPNGNFMTRHPFLSTVLGSLLVGVILLFSFWEKAVKWLEGIF